MNREVAGHYPPIWAAACRLQRCMLTNASLWNKFPELGPYALGETLIQFQFDRKFCSNYRNHAVHQLTVFLLGLFVYENCPAVKNEIDEEIRLDLKLAGDAEEAFLIRWLATALFHDIGYVLV